MLGRWRYAELSSTLCYGLLPLQVVHSWHENWHSTIRNFSDMRWESLHVVTVREITAFQLEFMGKCVFPRKHNNVSDLLRTHRALSVKQSLFSRLTRLLQTHRERMATYRTASDGYREDAGLLDASVFR